MILSLSLVTIVNWAILLAIVLSLSQVIRITGGRYDRQVRTADTDPEKWPQWLGISACLLLIWGAFWWCVPRFSPICVVHSKIDRAYAVKHRTRYGDFYYDYKVLFRPAGFGGKSEIFNGPPESMHWPTEVSITYSYRIWDRVLVSFRASSPPIVWENRDQYFRFRVFTGLITGLILLLATYLLSRDAGNPIGSIG